MQPKKIRIVGGPGSGKTHLAQQLSTTLKLSCHDLDNLYWDNNNYHEHRDEQERDQALKTILKQKGWIIEGVYGNWTQATFKQADLIIILKPKTFTRSWRITKRFINRKIGLEQTNKKETWKHFKELYQWSKHYYEKNFPGVYEHIKPYENKTITITKARYDIKEILER